MAFFDIPLEVIEEIIDSLQDDPAALKACSQTCQSLLLLCRKYIFRTINLVTPREANAPSCITLFGSLLDRNPQISDYVRNLTYYLETPDLFLESVPRTLDKLHRIQSFQFIGDRRTDWSALHPDLRESLSHIIHSVTHLDITFIKALPIDIFIPCRNLINLKLDSIAGTVTDSYEHGYLKQDAVPRLQSLTLGSSCGRYMQSLIEAKRSKDIPVLDFGDLRTLSISIGEDSDLAVFRALMKVTKKLETFHCTGRYQHNFIYLLRLTPITLVDLTDGYSDHGASINISTLPTLRRLHFVLLIEDDIENPLCRICDEFAAFSGYNVVEEIILEIMIESMIETDNQSSSDSQWGRLDDLLATGFPRLTRVSLRLEICVFSPAGIVSWERLNKLPEQQFPRLSKNPIVMFDFSLEVTLI